MDAPDPDAGDREAPDLLFAYGTLGPADPEASARADWVADRVRGRLYDLGPYPVLVDWDDPTAGWVAGHVRRVGRRELEGRLDPYEGVGEGLYRRIALTTQGGRSAWAYVYPHPLPPGALGPLARWDGPGARAVTDPEPPEED